MMKNDEVIVARNLADKALKECLIAERNWARAAKNRDPNAWRSAIDRLKCSGAVRIKVACIVWWDQFGSRPASKRWAHLDDLTAKWNAGQKVDRAGTIAALVHIGYPARIASRRIADGGAE